MNMREIINLLEAAKNRPSEDDLIKIREIREEIRDLEGGGGMCHFVSEVIMDEFGWTQAGGSVTSPNGDVWITSHRWNILPDGAILDATFDQLGQGKDIAIIEKNNPMYSCYRLEWDEDYNPSMSDTYPELHGAPNWKNEFDFDHVNRLRKQRGDYWYVTHPEQHKEYLSQQKKYDDAYLSRTKNRK